MSRVLTAEVVNGGQDFYMCIKDFLVTGVGRGGRIESKLTSSCFTLAHRQMAVPWERQRRSR